MKSIVLLAVCTFNMSYYVCEPKCTSNADCFSACVHGVCVVG
jgi:hypothetical protein